MRHICKGEDEEGRSRDLKRKRQSRILRDPATDLPNNLPPREIYWARQNHLISRLDFFIPFFKLSRLECKTLILFGSTNSFVQPCISLTETPKTDEQRGGEEEKQKVSHGLGNPSTPKSIHNPTS